MALVNQQTPSLTKYVDFVLKSDNKQKLTPYTGAVVGYVRK